MKSGPCAQNFEAHGPFFRIYGFTGNPNMWYSMLYSYTPYIS